MKLKEKKLEIALVMAALIVLIVVWAVNGYENTWLYVMAGIIVIPVPWYFSGKKNNDQFRIYY